MNYLGTQFWQAIHSKLGTVVGYFENAVGYQTSPSALAGATAAAGTSSTMPLTRCSLCRRRQLPSPNKRPAVSQELVVFASGDLAAHGLCLSLSRGLRTRRDLNFSREEIEAEVSRCAKVPCDLCGKVGAAATCAMPRCDRAVHIPCYYALYNNGGGGNEKSLFVIRPMCKEHANAEVPSRSSSPTSPAKVARPATRGSSTTPSPPKLSPPQGTISSPLKRPVGRPRKDLGNFEAPPKLESSATQTNSSFSPVASAALRGKKSGNPWTLRFCLRCRKSTVHTKAVTKVSSWPWSCKVCSRMKATAALAMAHNGSQSSGRRGRKRGSKEVTTPPSPPKVSDIKTHMKFSFCKEIDLHLHEVSKVESGCKGERSRTDRSPLGPKQKDQQPQHEKSSANLGGKENDTVVTIQQPKTFIPVTPVTAKAKRKRDAWIVPKTVNGSSCNVTLVSSNGHLKTKAKKASLKVKKLPAAEVKKKAKSEKTSAVFKKPQLPEAGGSGQQKKNGVKKPDSPAKKFVENCQPDSPTSNNSSQLQKAVASTVKRNLSKLLDGGSDDANGKEISNYKSGKKLKVKDLVQKISVEPVKMKNRLLFHVHNSVPIGLGCQEEAVEDYSWQAGLSDRQIDDFVDLNPGEKAFFKLWNRHLFEQPCYGNRMMLCVLDAFIDDHALDIVCGNLYKNFLLHLTNLVEYMVLDQLTMMRAVERLQRRVCEFKENRVTSPSKRRDAAICTAIVDRALTAPPPPLQPQPQPLAISEHCPLTLNIELAATDSASASPCSTPLSCHSSHGALYLSDSEGEGEVKSAAVGNNNWDDDEDEDEEDTVMTLRGGRTKQSPTKASPAANSSLTRPQPATANNPHSRRRRRPSQSNVAGARRVEAESTPTKLHHQREHQEQQQQEQQTSSGLYNTRKRKLNATVSPSESETTTEAASEVDHRPLSPPPAKMMRRSLRPCSTM